MLRFKLLLQESGGKYLAKVAKIKDPAKRLQALQMHDYNNYVGIRPSERRLSSRTRRYLAGEASNEARQIKLPKLWKQMASDTPLEKRMRRRSFRKIMRQRARG
jgi:hypothetical protein